MCPSYILELQTTKSAISSSIAENYEKKMNAKDKEGQDKENEGMIHDMNTTARSSSSAATAVITLRNLLTI